MINLASIPNTRQELEAIRAVIDAKLALLVMMEAESARESKKQGGKDEGFESEDTSTTDTQVQMSKPMVSASNPNIIKNQRVKPQLIRKEGTSTDESRPPEQ